jgi:hypothetical protein
MRYEQHLEVMVCDRCGYEEKQSAEIHGEHFKPWGEIKAITGKGESLVPLPEGGRILAGVGTAPVHLCPVCCGELKKWFADAARQSKAGPMNDPLREPVTTPKRR